MLNYQKLPLAPSTNLTRTLTRLMGTDPEANESNQDQPEQERSLTDFSQAIDNFARQSPDQVKSSNLPELEIKSAVILIVDDTPDNLLVLFSYLEEQGYKVLLAEDGASALQIAQTQAPDLILLDVLMPDLDGFETCRQLKAQSSTQEIPVIFLTALSETVNKVQGFKLGGVDYITKPSQQEEVLARIQTHLNLRQTRRTLEVRNQELQQALAFEGLVRRVTNKLRDSIEEKQILETATRELAELLELSSCQIELYDSSQTTATIAYEYNITLPPVQGIQRKIADYPELYQQLLEKLPLQLVAQSYQIDLPDTQVNGLVCPIFDDRGVIGNLWGLRPPGTSFTSIEIQLMQQIADQCAIAIRQARLYEASNQQIEQLAKLNQLKDDFLKTISHELKAPMSSIQLAAQTMENLLANPEQSSKSPIFQRVLRIFHESCARQNQLVDDLLTLCYIDAKAKTLKPESIDLNLWLPDLAQMYLDRTQNQQQQLILDLAPRELELCTDPLILERIVRELLHNACKYTPAEQTITIKTAATDAEISLCVINSGVEIAPEEQELIFNPFYRIPHSDPWQYGGTGLGLTLVKKLATMLRATVEIQSEQGQTVFCLRFPQ